MGFFRRAIGMITVEEVGGVITVYNVPTRTIHKDIKTIWATSRIGSYLFIDFTDSSFRIPSFFALEFEKIVETILASNARDSSPRALRRILEGLRESTWLARINQPHVPPLDLTHLNEIRFDLLPHQMDFLKRYMYIKPRYNLRGALLMVPPGGGKTISDISIAVCAKAEIVYIVCPKNAVNEVWRKTLLNDMSVPQTVWVAADGKPLDPEARWHIFHYETLNQAVALTQRAHGKRAVVILDESHNFNDIKSLRTDLFLSLCQKASPTDIVWASGTPVKAMGHEAVPLLRSIDPLFTPDVEMRFKKIFGADSSRALDILNHRLGIVSFKVPKSNFMSEKPVIKDVTVTIPNAVRYTLPYIKEVMIKFIKERMDFYTKNRPQYETVYYNCLRDYERTIRSSDEREKYRVYTDNVKTFLKYGFDARTMGPQALYCNRFEKDHILPTLSQAQRKPFIDAKSVVKYVDLKVRGECLGRILSKEREQCHIEMVASVDFEQYIDTAEKKTLVFTSYVGVVDTAFARLQGLGYSPLRVYGDTNSELQSIVKQFKENEDINPLIATYQSLSTAVPLIMANNLIMLNSPFRYHEQEQAISRCLRLGQDKTVTVYRVFLNTGKVPNLSTRSEDINEWSRQQVDAIIGIDSSTDMGFGMESIEDSLYCIDPPHVEPVFGKDSDYSKPASARW